ncbi:catalytic protein [Rutstroemia sp. NJR-2017a BVV2]|nr:catalytic protein [Rutstroemia sp. NJR-2017a BVV2]
MSKLSALAVVAILSFVEAKHCTHLTIPVTLNARNGIFNLPPLTDHIAVTKFAQDFLRRGQNYTAAILQGYTTITDEYNIAATACRPDNYAENYNTWQFLTHGIGFDSG